MSNKRINKNSTRPYQKEPVKIPNTNDKKYPIWTFRDIDRDGEFRFDPNRKDFATKDFLSKMISFSNMTWEEIIRACW